MSVEHLTICEVGPRDGLQNEKSPISTEQKLALVNGLIGAGARFIELTSFVNPKAVPQMADADQLLPAALAAHAPQARVLRQAQAADLRFMSLVINEKGYERAIAAGGKAINIVVVASESLCQRNNRMSTQESLNVAKQLLARAKQDGVWARVSIAAAWVCPFDGPTPPQRVFMCADAVWEAGVDELALADTIGHAHPLAVGQLLEQLGKRYAMRKLAAHLHDTQAMGLANAYAAIQAGVRIFDTSVGGLGGCPFAPGATGNLATEDLVFMAHKMGFETGFNLDALWSVVYESEPLIGRRIGGRMREWWEKQGVKREA